jgi:large subunit ribosomal protein L10
MNRAEKSEVVKELNKTFQDSLGVILVSFDGIDVPDITELRRKIRESDSSYRVIKNTLALRAAEGTPLDEIKGSFAGPTAIAYTFDDPVALAKTLKEFVKSNEGMTVKGGLVEGQLLSVKQVEDLANMPPRDELLSKLLFLLNAPLTRLATALQSPIRNLAVSLGQVAAKKN